MPHNNDSAEDLKNHYDILMTRSRHEFGGSYDPVLKKFFAGPHIGYIQNENYKVAHVSHSNIGMLQEKYPKYKNFDLSKLRISTVKKLLSNFKFGE